MIAREGLLPASAALLLTASAAGLEAPLATVAGVCLSLSVVWFFRDNERTVPALPLAVVSPIDGRLVGAGERCDPWLERTCMRISLKLSTLGMRVIRSPIEGQVKEFWVRGGLARDADLETGSSPTCYALWIRTDEGDDVVLAVYGRRLVSRFKAEVAPGERIGQGKRIGFIYFGTAVTVYAPASTLLDSSIKTPTKARVTGGSQVLGTLVHDTTASAG